MDAIIWFEKARKPVEGFGYPTEFGVVVRAENGQKREQSEFKLRVVNNGNPMREQIIKGMQPIIRFIQSYPGCNIYVNTPDDLIYVLQAIKSGPPTLVVGMIYLLKMNLYTGIQKGQAASNSNSRKARSLKAYTFYSRSDTYMKVDFVKSAGKILCFEGKDEYTIKLRELDADDLIPECSMADVQNKRIELQKLKEAEEELNKAKEKQKQEKERVKLEKEKQKQEIEKKKQETEASVQSEQPKAVDATPVDTVNESDVEKVAVEAPKEVEIKPEEDTVYIMNKSGITYHDVDCAWAKAMSPDKVKYIKKSELTRQMKPCSKCLGSAYEKKKKADTTKDVEKGSKAGKTNEFAKSTVADASVGSTQANKSDDIKPSVKTFRNEASDIPVEMSPLGKQLIQVCSKFSIMCEVYGDTARILTAAGCWKFDFTKRPIELYHQNYRSVADSKMNHEYHLQKGTYYSPIDALAYILKHDEDRINRMISEALK